ncbi:hypothetical protein [Streptomyces sparsogenes]|uniref:Uncharacterized protein n=1 Tax=Streptomyces sparsogenes DSM 40356 TaxID=1331668 RepID=A0A1R1SND0_9ACTN|nr:hypothetical protein [Streptomyces sparsogenes]OMI39808.1 hypothetical protein SPAR_09086 [Streptomyces sparsogenes DSM 40356]
MDLSPLYSGNDYTAFGCLFGVRNHAGWAPVAAGRGLPDDASAQVRRDYEQWAPLGALHSATWVTWQELEALVGSSPATARPGTWTSGSAKLGFHRVTRGQALGPGSGWEHVFAVMKALAGRFGPQGVRLVAYFD